jgi:hypothetical protein
MNLRLIFQKDGSNTLSENITASFDRKPKKAYFFCGSLKENGFKIIEEEIADTSAKLFFAIGIDKKNTNRSMLENILGYTKDLYTYSNNQIIEFDSNVCIFEYAKEAVIYISTSNLSESGMKENMSIYTEAIYNLDDKVEKEEYKLMLKEILKQVESENFTKVDKETIEKLVEDKEIFTTRQYIHNVKSISELLGKSNINKENADEVKVEDDIYIQDKVIPKVDLSDISIDLDDIDLSNVEEQTVTPVETKTKSKKNKKIEIEVSKEEVPKSEYVEEYQDPDDNEGLFQDVDKDNNLYDEDLQNIDFNENETIDIGSMLFSKAKVKLDIPEPKKVEKLQKEEEKEPDEFAEEELVKVKKVNLNNVTNLIFELPTKATKGVEAACIKIPNYVKNMIPEFFGVSERWNNLTKDGMNYKSRAIKIEVVDAKTGEKFNDRNCNLLYKNGQSFVSINSEMLRNINYDENDIIRIIKLSDDIYHLEIISKDMKEYKLWSKLCNQKFKASARKFGMM